MIELKAGTKFKSISKSGMETIIVAKSKKEAERIQKDLERMRDEFKTIKRFEIINN